MLSSALKIKIVHLLCFTTWYSFMVAAPGRYLLLEDIFLLLFILHPFFPLLEFLVQKKQYIVLLNKKP